MNTTWSKINVSLKSFSLNMRNDIKFRGEILQLIVIFEGLAGLCVWWIQTNR